MFIMPLYLFIVVAYLFFTPEFQYRQPSGITKAKTNTQLIYTLIRTNRCMMNSSKQNRLPANPPALHAAILNFGVNKKQDENDCACNFLINHHFAYLANRVLRI